MKYAGRLFFLSLLLLVAKAASAKTAISGTESFVVADCANPTLALRFSADKAPLAVKTNNIANETSPKTLVAWSIAWQVPQPSIPSINEYQATGTVSGPCPAPGRYAIPISVVLDPSGTPEKLNIHLSRAAEPTLDAPTTVTLRTELPVIVGFPYIFDVMVPYVPSIRLREISSAATIETISASGGQLRNSAGEFIDTMLNPDPNPLSVNAGQGGDLKLRVSNTPPVGAYTTRLILHSPALKQNQTIDVTLKVAVLSIYLFITVVVGVVVGWLVNVWLAGRATLDTARLEAFRAAAALGKRATLQKDPAVQQRFISLVASLETAIRDAKTPQELQAELAKSGTDAATIEQEAGKSTDALRLALARVREVLEPGRIAPDSMVAQGIAPLAGELSEINAAAASGDVVDAQRRLDEFESSLLPSITTALQPWLALVSGKLDDLGEWSAPAQALELERQSVVVLIKTAYPAPAEQLVQQCNKIAVALRMLAVFTGPHEIAQALRSATAILSAAKPTLAQALSTLASELPAQAASNISPLDIMDKLATARRAAEMQMQLEKPGDPTLTGRLHAGDFPGAASLIAPPAAPAPVTAAAPALLPAPISRPATALPAAGGGAFKARLLIPALIPLDPSSPVTLDWGGGKPAASVTWSCNPSDHAKMRNGSTTGAIIEPIVAGFLTVSATNAAGPIAEAKTYVGDMTQTYDFTRLVKESGRYNNVIWAVTAVLTSFTGYLIFANAWIGSPADFFSAFVWGFFGQFSLDRIRETVKTTMARTLP